MKKIRTALAAFTIVTSSLLISFRTVQAPSIKGTVSPGWYAVNAWAISEEDTLYTSVTDGSFEFTNARPGVYRIIIEARSPYRHLAKDDVIVKEGQETVVELSLQKY
jgi:hypothetical protein